MLQTPTASFIFKHQENQFTIEDVGSDTSEPTTNNANDARIATDVPTAGSGTPNVHYEVRSPFTKSATPDAKKTDAIPQLMASSGIPNVHVDVHRAFTQSAPSYAIQKPDAAQQSMVFSDISTNLQKLKVQCPKANSKFLSFKNLMAHFKAIKI